MNEANCLTIEILKTYLEEHEASYSSGANFDSFTSIEEEAAKELVESYGSLRLDGLKSITEPIAKILAMCSDQLSLACKRFQNVLWHYHVSKGAELPQEGLNQLFESSKDINQRDPIRKAQRFQLKYLKKKLKPSPSATLTKIR